MALNTKNIATLFVESSPTQQCGLWVVTGNGAVLPVQLSHEIRIGFLIANESENKSNIY